MLAVVNWLVQSRLHTAAMMLCSLTTKSTKPTKSTNQTTLVGWMTVEWVGSGKPVGQCGFKILPGHTVVDLLDWLAQQDEHLVDARLFVGQGGPEVVVGDCDIASDSAELVNCAWLFGSVHLTSATSLTKLTKLTNLDGLVVTGGQLHQVVHNNLHWLKTSPCLRQRLLRACERRWCSLTAGWAETVLREPRAIRGRAFAKLASLVVNKHIQCTPFGSQRLLVAALRRLVWINLTVDIPSAALAALVKARLEDSEVVICSCCLLDRCYKDSFCLVVPDLLSRLDLAHCVGQLGGYFGNGFSFGYDEDNRRRAVALQIARSDRVPDLAELAGIPASADCNVHGNQDSIRWSASSILLGCAEHIRADDLPSVVLAGWNGCHHHLLSELAKHHNAGFDKAFFDIGGPQLVLQRFMIEELQSRVSIRLLSFWKSEPVACNYQHPAWACFGASIGNMWEKKCLNADGERVVWHLLDSNPWVRKAFRDSQPEDLAKHILASDPPSWLEHQIGCALSYIKD